MDRFNCSGTNTCRQYCEALRSQGVEVAITDDGCNVPDMFTIKGDKVVFDPSAAENTLNNPELVQSVGGALCGVLLENENAQQERKAVAELMIEHDKVFSARLDLWKGMLGATTDGRRFTDAELEFYRSQLREAEEAVGEQLTAASEEVAVRAQAAFDRRTLEEHGLLFDEQMISVVDRLVSNQMEGKPTLLVGDKGIAKTQAAKFVATMTEPDREPVIISGHGDMMSNEFIGQTDLEDGSTVFTSGKLVKAMMEGRPVILDEVNIGDQAVLMRLQDILLRRPGDKIMLQENGGTAMEIKPGFVVYATANEASARYQHRNVLDPAFRDRYDILQLHYPDSDNKEPIKEIPSSLMRLALASGVDLYGGLSRHLEPSDLEQLVRLAHITQHLYSVPARDAKVRNVTSGSTSNFLDDEPAMTDCITPRSLADIIKRCAPGNKPDMTLDQEIKRAMKGLDQAGSSRNYAIAEKALGLLKVG